MQKHWEDWEEKENESASMCGWYKRVAAGINKEPDKKKGMNQSNTGEIGDVHWGGYA